MSKNFKISEFGYEMPDMRLLNMLQWLREYTGRPINITDSARTPADHVQTYKNLERDKLIKTKGNGLGDIELIDYIPWTSRHLPKFGCSTLRAVDFKCSRSQGNYYTGEELHDKILQGLTDKVFMQTLFDVGYEQSDLHVGIGVGKHYVHLDFDRTDTTVWGYGY